MAWLPSITLPAATDVVNKIGLTVTRQINGMVMSKLSELARSLGVNVGFQYVLLGDISFDLVTYLEGIDESFGGEYAEHGLIGGKPRLQTVGEKLDEMNWQIVLHAGYCDVEAEMLKLRQAVKARQGMALVYANGDYRGTFVPVDGSITKKATMRDGTAIWAEATLKLREFVPEPTLAEQPATQPAKAAEKSGNKPSKAGKHTPKARAKSKPAVRKTPRAINRGML